MFLVRAIRQGKTFSSQFYDSSDTSRLARTRATSPPALVAQTGHDELFDQRGRFFGGNQSGDC